MKNPIVRDRFYGTIERPNALCQGDILELNVRLPFLDEEGDPSAQNSKTKYWLLVGNSCDMTREIRDVPTTQIIPILNLGNESVISSDKISGFKKYQVSKRFYLPSWEKDEETLVYVADFLQPVTVRRSFLRQSQVRARLVRESWFLLHACLVRFLARDDGRFDSA